MERDAKRQQTDADGATGGLCSSIGLSGNIGVYYFYLRQYGKAKGRYDYAWTGVEYYLRHQYPLSGDEQ